MAKNKDESIESQYDTGFDLKGTTETRLSCQNDQYKTKRILTLDGGGVRGALSLGILSRIETVLSQQWADHTGEGADTFRLWHYFDWIVGTSTGAIIACLLSAGLKVQDILNLYKKLGNDIFPYVPTARQLATTRDGVFRGDKLPGFLNTHLKRIPGWPTYDDCNLIDAPLKTGIGILLRRIDTDHTWLAHNNRHAKYYSENSDLPLVRLVCASTAAPPYFKPVVLKANKKDAAFIDGGISSFNNPSLGAFIIATLKQEAKKDSHGKSLYRGFRWDMGGDKLLLVSVGTGWLKETRDSAALAAVTGKKKLQYLTNRLIVRMQSPMMSALMGDANFLTQAMLLWMSDSQTRSPVHGAAGTFSNEYLYPSSPPNPQKQFLTYLRYNAELERDATYPLAWRGKKDFQKKKEQYFEFTDASNIDELVEIGEYVARYGANKVEDLHFPKGSSPITFTPEFWPKL